MSADAGADHLTAKRTRQLPSLNHGTYFSCFSIRSPLLAVMVSPSSTVDVRQQHEGIPTSGKPSMLLRARRSLGGDCAPGGECAAGGSAPPDPIRTTSWTVGASVAASSSAAPPPATMVGCVPVASGTSSLSSADADVEPSCRPTPATGGTLRLSAAGTAALSVASELSGV